MPFTFRIQTREGEHLGDRCFGVPAFHPGETISLAAGNTVRVVEQLDPGDATDEGLPILIVEPA